MASSELDEILSRFGMSKDSLEHPCTREVANNIALKITGWRVMAPFLELSEVDEEDIMEGSRPGRERNLKMMKTWLHKGQSATYLKLAKAFMQVKRRDLVEKLCEVIQKSKGSALLIQSHGTSPHVTIPSISHDIPESAVVQTQAPITPQPIASLRVLVSPIYFLLSCDLPPV